MKSSNRFLTLVIGLAILASGAWLLSCGKAKPVAAQKESKIDYYYCPMHPQIHLEKPGTCSICGMTLVPRFKKEGMASEDSGIPEALQGLATIHLTPWRQQLIGVKLSAARIEPVTRRIVTVGRFAGGGGDFASTAGDFTATGMSPAPQARYLVADVYALDIPMVRVGQRAWVSSFSGSGPKVEGKVAQIYPYDGTQSRVERVRVNLSVPMPRELFANVEIEVMTPPRLSVPADAVLNSGLHPYVFLQGEPGQFIPHLVTLGFKGETIWEITSGLKEGDQVVSGANFLVDSDSKLENSFGDQGGGK